MSHRLLWISAALAALCGTATAQTVPNQRPAPAPYTWKSVQMVGGGFVDGIVFHPTAKGVRYARTDIGGAYRWNDIAHRWEPMLDWVPCENLNWMGVESIAVDASDPNRVYLACGTYTNPTTPDGAILRSSDRGKTFPAHQCALQVRRQRSWPRPRRAPGRRSQRRRHSLSGYTPRRPLEERRPRGDLEQGGKLTRSQRRARPPQAASRGREAASCSWCSTRAAG